MKKILKNNIKIILAILITAVIAGGVSVYATYTYLAENVEYTKANGTKVSVEEALNELYNKNNNITSRVVACQSFAATSNNATVNIEYTFEKAGYVIVNLGTRSTGSSKGTTKHSIKINDVEQSSNNEELWVYTKAWTGNVEVGDTIKIYVNDSAPNSSAFAFVNLIEK